MERRERKLAEKTRDVRVCKCQGWRERGETGRETKAKRTGFQTACRKRGEDASPVDFPSNNPSVCQSRASMRVLTLIGQYSKRRKDCGSCRIAKSPAEGKEF